MKKENLYATPFATIYPYYLKKAEAKGRMKSELDAIICWLTGYDAETLQKHLSAKTDLATFYNEARLHPNATKITGVVCGVRVEEIDDSLMQKIRYLDKLIDELAKGKAMEKILRP